MGNYVPHTPEERSAMLAAIGLDSLDQLFSEIPQKLQDVTLTLPPALTELELQQEMAQLADHDLAVNRRPSFLGAGAYRHFIPSVVGAIQGRSEFYTAYTPYQPEISQGTLQSAFEFQTMMCYLTGMDAANTGMYDGPTALAEAALMACRVTGRAKVAVLSTVNPRWRAVVETYCIGQNIDVRVVTPHAVSLTDADACLITQYPNFFGYVEDLSAWEQAAHREGAELVVAAGLMSLGMLKPPGDLGADIVVGEGQELGQPLNFGGPNVGVFCCRDKYLRQMPGRIVGRTTDIQGRTGYVLTLQTREQHIRREHATSNICTSEALIALGVAVYLAALGPKGLREVAELSYHKAHYLAGRLATLPGYSLPITGTFFNEFVVRCPIAPKDVNLRLLDDGILGGFDVSDQVENGLLLCCTELNSKTQIDGLVDVLGRISR